MTSSVSRDFASPELEGTTPVPNHEPQPEGTPRVAGDRSIHFAPDAASPNVALPSPILGRTPTDHTHRGSITSISSTNTAALRQRRMSRSNTVKAYHEDGEHAGWQPGAEPGIDAAKEEDEPRLKAIFERVEIEIVDYSADDLRTLSADNDTLKAVLNEPRPEDLPCRWISVNGLSWDVIKMLANKYKLHRLAVEDLIYTRTRTKVDWYSDHAFAVLTLQKLVRIHSHDRHTDCDCEHDEDGNIAAYGESHKIKPFWKPFSGHGLSLIHI